MFIIHNFTPHWATEFFSDKSVKSADYHSAKKKPEIPLNFGGGCRGTFFY
jgi:hypothetical protein